MKFTLLIKWRSNQDYNMGEASMTLPDIIQRLQDIHDTAGADLIETILISPEGYMFDIGKGFKMDLDGKVALG